MAGGTCDDPFGQDLSAHYRPLRYADERQVWQEGNIQRARWFRMKYAPDLTFVPVHCNKEDR
jgi:hypothetical protein